MNAPAVDPGRLAFGQERMLVTPLQMAMVSATIANGGIVMRPYVVDKVTAPNGSTVVLRICDPNWPRDPNVTITFDTADPMGEMKPLWSHKERDELQCFFTYAYQPIDPVPFRT